MKIESQDKSVDELLKSGTFVIPRFQREYSWEADHVSSFWSDVLENMSESYFIGAMVAYKSGRSTLAVVDGQQRLTTITIFLCAIREAYKELKRPDLADGLQAYIEKKDRENKTVYVLKTETSFPYLQEEILKNGEPEITTDIGREEEAIQRAHQIFRTNIDYEVKKFFNNKEQDPKGNNEDAIVWLNKLRDTLFDLNLILVTLDNEDDAYLIFETLNTRGKNLALADLLRNHFAKFLKPTSDVDSATLKWGKVLDTINSSPIQLDPDTFIVHSWQSRYDFVKKARIFTKVKENIVKKNSKSHLDRFVKDAEQWRSIFDPEYQWSKTEKEVARSLAALRTFKVVQPVPGILSLVRAYRDDIIKYRILRKAIQSIEKFHFSFNAVTSSRSSGGISGMYSSFGRQVFNANNSNDISSAVEDLVMKLRSREVGQSEFDAGFEQIIYTKSHSSQKSLVRYILRAVAEHEEQPFIGHTEDLTIEHLLPQSSSQGGELDDVVGQIGNLILVDQKTNAELATKNFQSKKTILLERGYQLPEILKNSTNLTDEEIAENTNRIAQISRERIWKV